MGAETDIIQKLQDMIIASDIPSKDLEAKIFNYVPELLIKFKTCPWPVVQEAQGLLEKYQEETDEHKREDIKSSMFSVVVNLIDDYWKLK